MMLREPAIRQYLFLLLLLLVSFDASAEDFFFQEPKKYALGLTVDAANGDYGGTLDTSFVATSLVFDWYPTDRLDFEVSVPFVYQSTAIPASAAQTNYTGPTSGGGQMFGGRMTTLGAMSGSGGPSGIGGTDSGGPTTTGNETAPMLGKGTPMAGGAASNGLSIPIDEAQNGVGDITLRVGYIVVTEGPVAPGLRVTGYVKFPTADEQKGLGTGEFDYGAGLSIGKWFGDWRPYADGTWVFQGSNYLYPETKDYLAYEGGISYQATDDLNLAMVAKGATATYEGTTAPIEGRLKGLYIITDTWSVEGYGAVGLSDGSPDYGGGLGLFSSF